MNRTSRVINTKLIKEHEEDVVKKGFVIQANFPNLDVKDFAEKLLIIINYKSNFEQYGIIDVKTILDTNIIEVKTVNDDATKHLLKQLVHEYDDIMVTGKFTLVDLEGFDVACLLEEEGLIEELEEVAIGI